MEWTDDECLLLIEMYKARPILWDPTNSQYKMAKRKIDYWSEIAKKMKKNVNEVKRKMESLLASYRRERRFEGSTSRSGAGADEVFRSKWFAFKAMQFLNYKLLPRETKNTIDPDNSQFLEDTTRIVNETSTDEVLEETSEKTEQPQERKKIFVSPKKGISKRKKANNSDRVVIKNLQNSMQDITDKRQTKKQKNDCTIFGEFIASKLEQFDNRTKTILQHQISTLIFNAELGFKFQPPVNQSQETSNSQIPIYMPHFQSVYSIPPQSTGTYHASTSSSMQLPYSTLTPSPTHHSTFSTQPQSPDTDFSTSSSPS